MATSAALSAGLWKLNGHKSLVLAATSANQLIVSARTSEGVGLYLVDAKAEGLRAQAYRTVDNHRAADIWLDGVIAQEVLALPGQAESVIELAFDHALVALCAEAVGAMEAALFLTRDYLKTRQQFGTTLSNFQALQHRMADMLVEVEMSRSIVYQGIAVLNSPERERQRGISAMKAITSSAAMFIGRNAIQLHGGVGMTEEYAVGHYYRRLYCIAHQLGGEQVHLRRMAANAIPFWPDLPAPQNALRDAATADGSVT